MTEQNLRTIKFTERGAVTKIHSDKDLTTENWILSSLLTTPPPKEFFIHQGIYFYLTSRVVKELTSI